MTETDHILGLVRRSLDEFDDVALATSARRALRIAHLRGDSVEAWWLTMDCRPTLGWSQAMRRSQILDAWPDLDSTTDHRLVDDWMEERKPGNVPDSLKQ